MSRRPALVSVIVPALNEAIDLPEQLAALSIQTYDGPWELLICDNGSVDGTQDVARSWAPKFETFRLLDASERKGCNHARNVGVANAAGDLVAFIDADDVASPGWLEALVDASATADVVGGSLVDLGAGTEEAPDQLLVKFDFLPSVPGGNCAAHIGVVRALGWDDEYVVGGTDIEFAWRAQLAGYRIAYARDALVRVRRPDSLRVLARQWYGYGSSGALLYRKFRRQGMPRPGLAVAARGWASLIVHVGDAFRGGAPRRRWIKRVAYRCGRVGGSIRHRVVFV